MPIVDGTIDRRWGYTKWTDPGAPVGHLIDYQSDITGARQVLASAGTYVKAYNDDGSTFNSSLFAPSVNIAPRGCTSRSFTYLTNGTDFKKWDGNSVSTSNHVSKWGIDANNATAGGGGTAGPNSPNAGNITDSGGSGGSGSQTGGASVWADGGGTSTDAPWGATFGPGTADISALDGQTVVFVMSTLPNNYLTSTLQITGFGFSIPGTATITGVLAQVWRAGEGVDSSTGSNMGAAGVDNGVYLMKAGFAVGTDHSDIATWADWAAVGAQEQDYGNSGDLWGTTLAPADVNAGNFGLQIAAAFHGPGDQCALHVDFVQVTVYYTLPATTSWTNVTNVQSANAVYATATATTSPTSQIIAENFGFALGSTQTPTGIQVDIKGFATGGTTPFLGVTLLKAGVAYAGPFGVNLPGANAYVTLGGPGNLWSGSWLFSDFNASTFGVSFYAQTAAGSSAISIDHVRITVYYSQPAFSLSGNAAGAITLNSGRQYTVCFKSTVANHYSDIWQNFTTSTGALAAQNQAISNIPVHNDPQVTFVELLATADGGDQTRLYQVAELTNGTTTYTDNTPEATLLNNQVFLSTDASAAEHGITDNDPPVDGLSFPTKHRGRIYMTKGPTLYWSKAVEDLTTDTGFIAGKWEESFPADNQIDVSEGAETPRGLLSDGVNLYIGTEFKIRRLNGDAPFLEPPDIVHNEVGITNQDVWRIVYREGTPAGAIWLTPDNRVVMSDFNSYQDLGTTVQRTLNSINQTVVKSTAYATFYGNGPFDLYILAVPTGVNTTNDTLLVFNMRTGKWVVWTLADKVSGFLYHIQTDGTPQLLIGAVANPIYELTENSVQDRIGNTPVSIPATIRSCWIDFGDASSRKHLNDFEIATGDSSLVVTVEGASNTAKFTTPNTVVSSRAVKLSPRGDYKVALASASTKDRLYRYTLSSSSASQHIVDYLSIEYFPINRL